MKVEVKTLTGIERVTEAAAWTQGTETVSISPERWLLWLKSEHSPIRAFRLRIYIYDVPYFVHVHLVRHHIGCQFYVRSQRADCLNPVDYWRETAPQNAPVNVILDANAQALISISRRRLCYKADEATRQTWEAVKAAITVHEDPYVAMIAEAMLPNCQYQGRCHELKSCGRR